ncbi:type II CRISPR-associated endonuclease Cas1 [Azospirillum sp. B21]|uniref:type II CRISPR-associated endonuclease Cas1 n=1 Tax=Azospirillum sp. B21 TaxID=2607496 RepID=UPI0011ED9BE1|nr:type II CRISPR-associated endonuclease Cas1 [Azospirillum sp. B21]KAA0579781.1 type II CRISPR-associated endonuclease Cas1 [Azospirillum sp. B21]
MTGRIVEIAEDGRHLSLSRGFLVVEGQGREIGRVPLDDIGAVVANAHGLTYSNNLLLALAERGVVVVLCGPNHVPAAFLWPVDGHHVQAQRMRAQLNVSVPQTKRLWQLLVRAKVRQQGAVLEARGAPAGAFEALARKVRSGDPDNIEAQAARRYWPLLFGNDFRRDSDADGMNGLLNYGYAILRSTVARAVMGAGLHPTLGLFHRNRANPLCLVDDLMEPFRPFVDLAVARLADAGHEAVTPDTKRFLALVPSLDLPTAEGTTPLSTVVMRAATSLAQAYEKGEAVLDLPAGEGSKAWAPKPLEWPAPPPARSNVPQPA